MKEYKQNFPVKGAGDLAATLTVIFVIEMELKGQTGTARIKAKLDPVNIQEWEASGLPSLSLGEAGDLTVVINKQETEEIISNHLKNLVVKVQSMMSALEIPYSLGQSFLKELDETVGCLGFLPSTLS